MSFLGISRDSGAVYVGESLTFGYRCSTDPTLTPIRFVIGGDVPSDEIGPTTFHLAKRIFKEVYFDPVTRLRRGEVFSQEGAQPARWLAQDPYRKDLGNAFKADGSRYNLELVTYQHDRLSSLQQSLGKRDCPRVILGSEGFVTFWKIISVETAVNHVPVLTLKAEQFFGDIPEVVHESIPESLRSKLLLLLDDVASSAHRLSPVAVVDRCRDCLALVFAEKAGEPGLDLFKAVTVWAGAANEMDSVRAFCGRIVARLHSRGKPNEQLKRGLRPLSESDAVLALRCLWTVLVDFGWAH
jgi:hypothetical protein